MDDLDDRLRAAMKALDERAGGAVDLEAKVLARLASRDERDGNDMNDVMTEGRGDTSDGAPPRPLSDDSGLHDIKALAKTTRQRVSRRITSQHDIDEQLLTSSQSGLRAVALPEPAKLIALPSVAELAERLETSEPAVARAAHKVAARSGQPRRAPVAWIAGGVAAVAAIVIGVVVIKGGGGGGDDGGGGRAKTKAASEQTVASAREDRAYGASAAAMPRQEAVQAAMAAGSAAGSGSGAGSAAASGSGSAVAEGSGPADNGAIGAAGAAAASGSGSASGVPSDAVIDGTPPRGHGPVVKSDTARGKDQPAHAGSSSKLEGGKDAHKPVPGHGAVKAGDGSRSLDDLIDEAAGGPGGKKPAGNAAPATIDKKELTSQDIRTAMGSVAKRAQACYDKFNQAGTVGVKASVAPSGKITKVTITGAFAGTPTGECVAAVVEGVSFPAWDGAPMSVSYSYLLSE